MTGIGDGFLSVTPPPSHQQLVLVRFEGRISLDKRVNRVPSTKRYSSSISLLLSQSRSFYMLNFNHAF